MVTIEEVREARSRFAGRVTVTPMLKSYSFSRMTGREVYLKAECMQRAGSFKIRGALNVLSQLDGRPVVAASAGNHAQGVALAASMTGSKCTVFMPEIAPIPKIKATADYGAEVILKGSSLADAVDAALLHTDKTGELFVHPYDDSEIVTGQATLGLEIVEQLPEVGTVVVPTGGGGLLAGTAIAVKDHNPNAQLVGVEIDAAAVYTESRRRGHLIVDYPRGQPTVADGIAVSVPSRLVWDIIQTEVDHLISIDDSQATVALSRTLERSKLMVEAAGAVGVGALMEGLIPEDAPDPICIVLSGGNLDLMLLGKAVRHGLETTGRFGKYLVRVPDQPGNLAQILTTVAEQGGNVVQVDHHREGSRLPFGTVEIELSVETRDAAHATEIQNALNRRFPS